MPLAQGRSDSEFAFPNRVLGPVQEHRRLLSGGAWGEDVFDGRGRGAFMQPPQPLPFQKGYGMPPPSARYDNYDYKYSDYPYEGYEYDDISMEFSRPPPPPPQMMRSSARRPLAGPMGPPRGMPPNQFKSVGMPAFVDDARFHRATPPPPSLIEDMARFRRGSPRPPSPIVEDMARFRGTTGTPPPPAGMVGRRGGMRRASGYSTPPLPVPIAGVAAASAVGASSAIVGERALAAEVISEEVSYNPIGYEVWEEEITRPVVTPIMQTVVRQDPIMVEKRITQEVVAPMIVQEQGVAAAQTIVESGVAAPPTVIQEMGMAAAPTVVQEMGMMNAPPTVMGTAQGFTSLAPTMTTGVGEAMWETRPPTIVREMDSSLPPLIDSPGPGGMNAGFQSLEPAPIVVQESSTMIQPVAPIMPAQSGMAQMTQSMRPTINVNNAPIFVPPQGVQLPPRIDAPGYGNNFMPASFENGVPMAGGIGAPPVPSNMGPPPVGVNSFGGPTDLNSLGGPEAKVGRFARLRSKFHRHRQ